MSVRLGWQEIRKRAIEFSREFADATRENSETQTFYNEFFNVFGISRRRVASFEERVKKSDTARGRIDLFWPGELLVEQKSTGRDLTKARQQAFDYFPGLSEKELPRFVLISDFQNFELIDLETREEHHFTLTNFHKNIELFGFMVGYKKRVFKDQDKVNIDASEMMGRLHDQLRDTGYEGPLLELFLVRLLFCLFADDTGIFEKDQFTFYIEERTCVDGSDLGPAIEHLFQVLNTPKDKRASTLDDDLVAFPYVNGELFAAPLNIASFDSEMRARLLDACYFDWSDISPAIFGSLFQSVMDKDKRRAIGAHYTTEQNIMKVIEPLFLDELRAEFTKVKDNKNKLRAFHQKLADLRFLDPACGCGNFLIIAYRELRALEIEVLKLLHNVDDVAGFQRTMLDVGDLSLVNVDHFYGIELEEFPARIAEVALWLVDHQMNMKLSEAFGVYYVRIPLTTSPHIVHGNALKIDWQDVIAPQELNYILGNPPFVGHQWRKPQQKVDHDKIWGTNGKFGRLDFVACWHNLAVEMMKDNPLITTAFVSTNSIVQGEQASILWDYMFQKKVHIFFAHRTFQWGSDARGKAAVHCVIVGLTIRAPRKHTIYDYQDIKGQPQASEVTSINGYLLQGNRIILPSRSKPKTDLPFALQGSKPADGARVKKPEGGYIKTSNLILDEDGYNVLINKNNKIRKWLLKYMGSEELLSGKHRWCLWLKDILPDELKELDIIHDRLERVRHGRLLSPTKSVQDFANFPTLFTQDRQPTEKYLAIPEVSSETRRYLPMRFLDPNIIASNKLLTISGATILIFGLLSSSMHMGWMRTVAGRLKSDYSYSPSVYNNFPWPEDPTEAQTRRIEEAAQLVLDTRDKYPESSLANLYDPLTMPPDLLKAHHALDKAVDRSYRPQPFPSERHRIEFLFSLYEKITAPLERETKKK